MSNPFSVTEETHLSCSASKVKQRLLCPGSRRMHKEKVKRMKANGEVEQVNEYALEGIMLHRVTELLLYKIYPQHLPLSTKVYNQVVEELEGMLEGLTKEQLRAVDDCVDYFDSILRKRLLENERIEVQLESKVDLSSFGLPETGGTRDVAIIGTHTKDVLDWKFGQGVPVFPYENPQIMVYGAGDEDPNALMIDARRYYLHIVQPRLDAFLEWETNAQSLLTWINETLIPGITLTRDKDAQCIPGEEQCKWCVGPLCKARMEMAKSLASDIFSKYATSNKETFGDLEEVAYMLEKAKILDNYIKDLSATVMQNCLMGVEVKGWKVVEGRAYRGWRDPKEAEAWLLEKQEEDGSFDFEDLYETKFVSVAKAEKLTKDMKKDDEFRSLWYKPEGKPTLVPSSDKREPFVKSATAAFSQFAL